MSAGIRVRSTHAVVSRRSPRPHASSRASAQSLSDGCHDPLFLSRGPGMDGPPSRLAMPRAYPSRRPRSPELLAKSTMASIWGHCRPRLRPPRPLRHAAPSCDHRHPGCDHPAAPRCGQRRFVLPSIEVWAAGYNQTIGRGAWSGGRMFRRTLTEGPCMISA